MTALSDRCIEAMARAICFGDPLITPLGHATLKWPDDYSAREASEHRDLARAALIVLLSELDAAGFAVVPKEATEKMIAAIRRLDWTSPTDIDWPEGYAAMLATAPQPFPEDKP